MPKSQFSDAYDTFRQVMIDARKEQGITQMKLGELLSKPQSWISAYETGLRRLDVVEFIAISRALDLDPVRLFRDFAHRAPRKLDI